MAAVFGKNRRSHPRQPVRLMEGTIFTTDNLKLSEFNVRDVSPAGARIILSERHDLPKFVYMYDKRDRSHRYAEVIRQTANEVGLRFVNER